jgi:hypothetical protein
MYSLTPQRLAGPVTADAYEDTLAYLLGRDGLEEDPQYRETLRPLDAALAAALRHTSADWWTQLTKMSLRCGFAQADWWLNLLRQAVEEPAELQKAG